MTPAPNIDGQREAVARLLIKHSIATGHGDTHADLLTVLDAALAALRSERDAALESLREERDAQKKAARAYYDTVVEVHHALSRAGWHPGRTDDRITDIIKAKGKEMAALKAERDAAQSELVNTLNSLNAAMNSLARLTSERDAALELLRDYVRLRDTQYPGPAPHEWTKLEERIDAALAAKEQP